jgi:hypothetical protein
MKTRAVSKRCDQVSPDDFETVPVIVDVPDEMTMGELLSKMRIRMGYLPTRLPDVRQREMVFTVVVDPNEEG